MGRSTREQADANRRKIVSAAGKLFRSRGYDAVGISDVMQAAGMTQGGFYKHFASKEALAQEAWRAGFETAVVQWREMHGGASPLAALVNYYFASKPVEQCCPMFAHGGEAARVEAADELRKAFDAGAHKLYETFKELDRKSHGADELNLLFAAMVGANMLNLSTGDAAWVQPLKHSVAKAAKASTTTQQPDKRNSRKRIASKSDTSSGSGLR